MKFRRDLCGIDLKPEEFVAIGKEFKTEIKQNNINRALEILGKYNYRTLSKILDYNNTLVNINLNSFQMGNSFNKNQKTKEEEVNKENSSEKTSNENTNNDNSKNENSQATKKDESKKNNFFRFEIFNLARAYQKIFTPEEIEMIKEISADKEKLVEYLRVNSLALDSIILRNHYTTSVYIRRLRKENKLFYILFAIFIFWMGYDVKGTLKCKFIFSFINKL